MDADSSNQRAGPQEASPPPTDQPTHLACPICLGLLKEPYLTRCGHSFCHECIKRYLDFHSNCPTCQSSLTRDGVFPNFALRELLESGTPATGGINLAKQLQQSLLTDAPDAWTREDVHGLLAAILAKRDKLESCDRLVELSLLEEFLIATKRKKDAVMLRLQAEMQGLNNDLEHVQKLLGEIHVEDVPRKRKLDEETSARPPTFDVVAEHKHRLRPFVDDIADGYFEWRLDMYPLDAEAVSAFGKRLATLSKYSRFKTIAHLHYSDSFFSASNSIVSALEFDRDDEFFATAGVTKKIKIYEFGNIVAEYRDKDPKALSSIRGGESKSTLISNLRAFNPKVDTDSVPSIDGMDAVPRYPILEMSSRSKISCLSWNTYFKSSLASSDYEGIVSVWDTATGAVVHQMEEHEKRAWTVDFSRTDPTQLASGSDDAKVKVWSTSQRKSTMTIECRANVCSVKFNPDIGHQLAFGSADHFIHYYDLRNAATPLHVFRGHKKAVSYVKFSNKDEFVTASTDSTLKLWSINQSLQSGTSKLLRTFSGHTNEKNFVGLSVNCDGDLIACGSESNEVYVYYPSLTKPIVVHNFGPPLAATTGEAVPDEDPSQFVSSVAWRRHSPNQLIVANSTGRMKILELQ